LRRNERRKAEEQVEKEKREEIEKQIMTKTLHI
jgi:hypothetical protein